MGTLRIRRKAPYPDAYYRAIFSSIVQNHGTFATIGHCRAWTPGSGIAWESGPLTGNARHAVECQRQHAVRRGTRFESAVDCGDEPNRDRAWHIDRPAVGRG